MLRRELPLIFILGSIMDIFINTFFLG